MPDPVVPYPSVLDLLTPRALLSAATATLLLTACTTDPPLPAPFSPPPLPEGAQPAALCPVDSMVDLYPGEYANHPLDPQPPASACVAAAHDVLIVLGCPNEADGAPSACQIARADIAVAFMEAGYGDHFITTGGAVHNEWVEADTLRDLLVARGVPPESIVTETQARHTDENIYYSTLLMEPRGWVSAVVVSEQRGHLTLTSLCDSNCCVDLGRLTIVDLPLPTGAVTAGHYVRYPWAVPVSDLECTQIEQPTKFMCTNLKQRLACADSFQL